MTAVETAADDYAAERDGDGPPDDLCGLCGIRRAAPGHTACSTCA